MKGVVLAGGLGTRLYPVTFATNKHLLPIFNKPMVFYPIETLVKAGVDEIMVVVGGPHAGHFMRVLKNGEDFGLKKLVYAVQEGEGGIPAALKLAEGFVDKNSVCVILGDNTTDADVSADVKNFKSGAKIFLKEVPDPERFGVPTLDSTGRKITKITEKPKEPNSNFAVTGLYIYDNKVFDFIKTLKPSGRGELEVTDLNNKYIELNELEWTELNGYWRDAGKFETILEASNYWAEKAKKGN